MDITVTPQNSPYNLTGGTQNFNTVTINGGWMVCYVQDQVTITTLVTNH